jgi:hypothetical protein
MAGSLAHKATVHVDAGCDGRVLVADSLSFYEQPWTNDVAVGASFAGAPHGSDGDAPGRQGVDRPRGGSRPRTRPG